jgi:hypothetical protein
MNKDMKNIKEETIKKILKLKEALAIMNVDEKDIVFMPEPIHPIAYGTEKAVIFIEIAGIKVVNIIGTGEED